MATKISDLTSVSSLDGSELIEVVQSGANKKVSSKDLNHSIEMFKLHSSNIIYVTFTNGYAQVPFSVLDNFNNNEPLAFTGFCGAGNNHAVFAGGDFGGDALNVGILPAETGELPIQLYALRYKYN